MANIPVSVAIVGETNLEVCKSQGGEKLAPKNSDIMEPATIDTVLTHKQLSEYDPANWYTECEGRDHVLRKGTKEN